jgi:hypothetical protein
MFSPAGRTGPRATILHFRIRDASEKKQKNKKHSKNMEKHWEKSLFEI